MRGIVFGFMALASVGMNTQPALAPLPLVLETPSQVVTKEQIRTYLAAQMKQVEEKDRQQISRLIRKLSARYNFHPGLILSVIKVESNFQRYAISPVGALGLMQLMPDTAEWLAPRCNVTLSSSTQLFEADTNIKLGVCYLSILRKKFNGDLEKALLAYNEGPAKIDEKINSGRTLALGYYNRVRQHLSAFSL